MCFFFQNDAGGPAFTYIDNEFALVAVHSGKPCCCWNYGNERPSFHMVLFPSDLKSIKFVTENNFHSNWITRNDLMICDYTDTDDTSCSE